MYNRETQKAYYVAHREKRLKYNKEYWEKNTERLKALRMAKYQERKEKGICVACGKVKAIEGKTLCFECALEKSWLSRKQYQKRKAEQRGRNNDLHI